MTSTTSSPPTIAFFGATGGCAHACLVFTLRAGYTVTALARTPSKMTSQLLADGITQETLDAQLTIIQGSSKDVNAVKRTLCPSDDGILVTKVISGIGGTPKPVFNPIHPFTLDDPTICEQSMLTLIQALQELQAAHKGATKPLVCYISTTGTAKDKPRDVPIAFLLLYHMLLAVPHADKRKLEQLAAQNVAEVDESKRVFSNFIGVRASLLTGGVTASGGKGLAKVRVGREMKPAIGYTISRADVGLWIFENVVRKDGQEWLNESVTVTY